MARMFIVVGDPHTGAGRVLTGSRTTDIDGKPVARVGDLAICPLHKGSFPIVTGDITVIVDGKPLARHGDKLACGCSLIATGQGHVFVDAGGGGAPAAAQTAAKIASAVAALAPASSDKSAVCEECLKAAAESASAFLGR